MRTAVVTVTHGRHDHLRRQEELLYALSRRPDQRIVVAMNDPEIARIVRPDTVVVELNRAPARPGLPLAAARNTGAAAAIDAGAELLIFLDVDCLPGDQLVHFYERAASIDPDVDALYAGPVAYLPPPPPEGYDLGRLDDHDFHRARPAPAPGERHRGGDHRLFWSLSFATTAAVWSKIGGFDEQYQGYGAEDTDFAMLAQQAGVELTWVGGASAIHQWHPTASPPVHHLDDILRNGALFATRWGWWPMEGWLEQFEAQALIRSDGAGGWLRVDGHSSPDASGATSREKQSA